MYQIDYEGEDHETSTLNAALDWATQLVTQGRGEIDGVDVEQDEITNTWYVQSVIGTQKVGPAAIVSGPDVGSPVKPDNSIEKAGFLQMRTGRHSADGGVEFDGVTRLVVISGDTPAGTFRNVAAWLDRLPGPIRIGAVHFFNRRRNPFHVIEITFDSLPADPDVRPY